MSGEGSAGDQRDDGGESSPSDPTDAWPTTPDPLDLFADDLLADEVVLVTGGGTGIGRVIALGAADLGADVAIASRDMDHLDPVASEIESRGRRACATTVDVRERDEVAAMTETVIDELGDVSVLVNNAGANFLTPASDLSANGWRAVVGTILDGTANCTFEVGEHLCSRDGGGAIVSIGATNAVRGAPYHAHSGAGKAGVHNLMQSVAAEWAPFGVRANTVAPGVIETEGAAKLMAGGVGEQIVERDLAADRLGRPGDCVPMTLFLASEASRYVTGAQFVVDGGQLLAPVPG